MGTGVGNSPFHLHLCLQPLGGSGVGWRKKTWGRGAYTGFDERAAVGDLGIGSCLSYNQCLPFISVRLMKVTALVKRAST